MKKVVAIQGGEEVFKPTSEWIKGLLDEGRVLVISDVPYPDSGVIYSHQGKGILVDENWLGSVHSAILYKDPDSGEYQSSNFVFIAIVKEFQYASLGMENIHDYPSYVNAIRQMDIGAIQDQAHIDKHQMKVKVLPETCKSKQVASVDKSLDCFVLYMKDSLKGQYSSDLCNCQMMTEFILSTAFPELEGDWIPELAPLEPGVKVDHASRQERLLTLKDYFSKLGWKITSDVLSEA